MNILTNPTLTNFFLSLISLVVVAFGQPARSSLLGVFAACFGYTLFWYVLLQIESRKKRFWLSTIWFTALQLIQLSWLTSHPFLYIYLPYLGLSFLQGLQFGLLGLFITKENLTSYLKIIAIAAFWVIMEWSRLFFMSGYSWNPAGMALAGNPYSLQMASLFGVYGLSFWVILVNLLLLKYLESFQKKAAVLFALTAITPYIYGMIHLHLHEAEFQENQQYFTAVLVQPSFSVDGTDHIQDRKDLIAFVLDQWKRILHITKKQQDKKIDLIVLPEYVVPFGTYTALFPLESVRNIFKDAFGEDALAKLPALDEHLVQQFRSNKETITFVNNAYWLQGFANLFEAPVIAGLEDVDDGEANTRNYYSAALYFSPSTGESLPPERYEKRVLVPLGEYIPFSFCRQFAMHYGVAGSFTCGEKAKVFAHPKTPFGASICYEETFGDVMRENRKDGAELLVNLTNDGWFPDSKLTKQHFDHARLRSVESGVPSIRACNTGITGGFDSLGRVVAVLGDADNHHESLSDSLLIEVPTYHYQTIYSKFGDNLILFFSVFAILCYAISHLFFKKN